MNNVHGYIVVVKRLLCGVLLYFWTSHYFNVYSTHCTLQTHTKCYSVKSFCSPNAEHLPSYYSFVFYCFKIFVFRVALIPFFSVCVDLFCWTTECDHETLFYKYKIAINEPRHDQPQSTTERNRESEKGIRKKEATIQWSALMTCKHGFHICAFCSVCSQRKIIYSQLPGQKKRDLWMPRLWWIQSNCNQISIIVWHSPNIYRIPNTIYLWLNIVGCNFSFIFYFHSLFCRFLFLYFHQKIHKRLMKLWNMSEP